jgi:signal transduction histidine kinase
MSPFSREELQSLDASQSPETSQPTRAEERLRALTVHLQSIHEEARRRMAREIHDELGQALIALKIDLSWVSKKISGSETLVGKVDSMVGLVNETLQRLRQLEAELRPAVLDDLGLSAALEWQVQEFQKYTGIPCELHINHDLSVAPGPSTELFRGFQEILATITGHARATLVTVTFEQKDEHLLLTVRDNGIGIQERNLSAEQAIRLISIRERMRPLGGEVIVTAVPEAGGVVVVRVPVDRLQQPL